MAALPYMQLYVADYLADTGHLTTEEHGAYLLLLFSYWQTGKPLRSDRLATVARMSNDRWISVENTLTEFFRLDINVGYWTHLRVEADLHQINSKSKQAKDAGKKSAMARALAKRGLQTDVATTVSTDDQRNLNHTRSRDTDTDTDTDKEQDQKQLAPADADADQPKKTGSKKSAEGLVGIDQLIAEGCDPDHARDWLQVRKGKRAPLTVTAWKGMHREAAKAGINISLAVQISAERNWQAFNAEYNWGGINPSAPSAKTLNEWETPTRAQILAKGPRSDGKVPHDKWDSGVHQFVFPLSDDIDPRMVDRQ